MIRDIVIPRVLGSSSKQAMEPRLSIYGFGEDEWVQLSRFFCEHRVLDNSGQRAGDSDDCRVKWMIQVPRLCNVFMGKKYNSFGINLI